MKLKNIFKRKSPYSPVAYIGRKTTAKILGARITKLEKKEKRFAANEVPDQEISIQRKS